MTVDGTPRPQLRMRRALTDVPAPSFPTGYALRTMEPADMPTWVDLMNRNGELGLWTLERAAPLFDPDGGRTVLPGSFVVEHADGLVATAQLNLHDADEFAPLCELGWVAADPAHRGRGLGKAVCAAVLRAAGAAGNREIFLRTDDHRLPAIRVYLDLGFTPWSDDPDTDARWRAVRSALERH